MTIDGIVVDKKIIAESGTAVTEELPKFAFLNVFLLILKAQFINADLSLAKQ